MTLDAFRARYPEFRTATDELVQAVMAEAVLRVDPEAYGPKVDIAIGLMAAHLLLNSPYGRSQRLEATDSQEDRYRQELDELIAETIPAILVL